MSSVCVVRRRDFWAVWNWSWKLKVLGGFLAFLGYFLCAVPVVCIFDRLGILGDPYVEMFINVMYAPLIWLDTNVEEFRSFFRAEGRLIEWLLGSK